MMTIGVLLSAGCTHTPKPGSHEVAVKLPYWEYQSLGITNFPPPSNKSELNRYPEVKKMKREGWMLLNWHFVVNPGEVGPLFVADFKRPSPFSH